MELVLNSERDKAVAELESYYIEIEKVLNNLGWTYYVHNRTDLEDWEAYKHYQSLTPMKIPIWGGASDKTIYKDVKSLYRLRFWHDLLHVSHDVGFSYEEEKFVASLHMKAAEEAGLSVLARRLLFVEFVGQIEYHKVHGDFPVNQAAFSDSCLQHGAKIASRLPH